MCGLLLTIFSYFFFEKGAGRDLSSSKIQENYKSLSDLFNSDEPLFPSKMGVDLGIEEALSDEGSKSIISKSPNFAANASPWDELVEEQNPPKQDTQVLAKDGPAVEGANIPLETDVNSASPPLPEEKPRSSSEIAANIPSETSSSDPAYLDTLTTEWDDSGDTPPGSVRAYSYPIPQRISLRDIQQKGIGYSKGYLTLDGLFGPDYLPGKFLPLLDVRGHRFDNNTYASNVGFVGRYVANSLCRILGLNAYWDYRDGCFGQYNQLGLGMEILCDRADFRFNGYIPFGSKRRIHRCRYDFEGGLFAIFHEEERIFQGFNAEAGWLAIKSPNFLLYGAAGPYYLSSTGKDAWGIKARLRPQYRDWAAIEASVSYDHIFHSIFQLELIFSLPLYSIYPRTNPRQHPCLSDRQIYQPVERFEIIPTKCNCGWKTNF